MKISPLFFITGLGMIGVAVAAALWITGLGAAWSVLLMGAAAWFIAMFQKITWAARLNKPIFDFIRNRFSVKFAGPVSWSYVGLLTGIFECGIAFIFVFLIPALRQANWPDALAFGVGFGAAEALFLGLGQLGYIGYAMLRPESIPEKERISLKITADSLLMIPIGIVERASALPIHIFTKVLIILAIQQEAYLLFFLSLGFKALVDGIAGWMHLEKDIRNVGKPAQWWAYEFIFIILALISIAGIMFLRQYPPPV